MIVTIVVVGIVGICGFASALLFYIAKKREWKVRERIRRSAKKVATALTPRRAEFPRSLKDDESSARPKGRRIKLDDVPPTPRIRPDRLDLEKGSRSVDETHVKSGRR
ncbi:hypothetical protein P8C59_008798 [Phyllachora maydis]|uniref:Uncharacterized protein n=1 Tax=Phyllachora maydis TaxID=1825666 RepID=A0AAD9IBC5_9PEZI|nr:hypothetical protein P8C59_008798 [Phyllachora maydis]